MRKTRRKLYSKTRRRRQRGGVGRLGKLVAILAAALALASPGGATPTKVETAATKLEATPSVWSALPGASSIASLESVIVPNLPAWHIPSWETFSEKVLEATKVYEETDKNVAKGLSEAMFNLADEVEQGKWSWPDVSSSFSPSLFEPQFKPGTRVAITLLGTYNRLPTFSRGTFVRYGKGSAERTSDDEDVEVDGYYIKEHETDPESFFPADGVALKNPTGGTRRKSRGKTLRRKK
jgi:hypothetical protein